MGGLRELKFSEQLVLVDFLDCFYFFGEIVQYAFLPPFWITIGLCVLPNDVVIIYTTGVAVLCRESAFVCPFRAIFDVCT